jgi:dTDP-4-dehydrorhamnose 3,5-epimerase
MRILTTKLQDTVLLEPEVFSDHRGWVYESYSYRKMHKYGIPAEFVQDNRALSDKRGTLRGLHCQISPMDQGKLVSCTRGAILDIAVDLREGSPTYMQWVSAELTAENMRQLWIPRGCLHGFVTLTDDVEVFYKVDAFYSPAHDQSVRWDDPAFGVDWGVERPVLSAKDANAPLWKDAGVVFEMERT